MEENHDFEESESNALGEVEKKTAPLFRVLMHNDDYTTMEFVVNALETIFNKNATEANQIMLNIHLKGAGMCGVYPFEIAETKADKVHRSAAEEGFPLKCSVEEV